MDQTWLETMLADSEAQSLSNETRSAASPTLPASPNTAGVTSDFALDQSIDLAAQALLRLQKDDGHWVFELEADATIPAEYVMLEHYMDRIDPVLQQKIGVYLRGIQGVHGGWPLFYDGAFNLSASVKAYFALKLIGDDTDAPHMQRARAAILGAGGAERSNVFTRIQLALYGDVPWRAVPAMPVEIMNLPRWFFFHLSKVSYWSRTVLVPLLVLMALRPRARNPRRVHVPELFRRPPAEIRDWVKGPYRSAWGRVFKWVDVAVRPLNALCSKLPIRRKAIQKAVEFVAERLNGDDGLGGIYPAIANSVMMYDALGYPATHKEPATAWSAFAKLMVQEKDSAYCQPCLSPVWDTALAGHAIAEMGGPVNASVAAACDWLLPRQITDVVGDWAVRRPNLAPGGWAFQYENAHYPDVDDTAVVGLLMHRSGNQEYAKSIALAREWVLGMQSSDGGWGAFEPENTHYFLNHIPFADHGALLDPPTADVTARCVSFLAQLDHPDDAQVISRAVAYLRRDQEVDGSWFGRWGTNYVYGTWSVLCALNAANVPHDDPCIERAVAWLLSKQRADGGWGEDNESYDAAPGGEHTISLPSQTAWAILGLMAAGQIDNAAVTRGVAFLQRQQGVNGEWDEKSYSGCGFPRVFYLRYHGYRLFFPLMALSRYRNLQRGNRKRVDVGF